MMKRFTIGLALAAVTLPTLAAPHFSGGMDRSLWRDLDLTAEQKTQLEALRDDYRAQRQQARSDFHTNMHTLLTQETFDEAAVRDLLSSQSQPNLERRVSHARHQHAMLQVLTAEQQSAFFDAMTEKRAQRGHGHRGKGQHHQPGQKGDCWR
ncbi:Spy/CpxP family protein refolding chaperone [Salinivibrio kushneri]|uniref:Spy/CpxP family protein refolding chaperone n=1 Tax=Salinivibrio kushneri TaxID=1908198 RepID=UPI0022B4DDBA|nr:Spy/CpxP family protein refolding chaperone [Salinivibrio kushneri]WBA18096.1 Spy/CpxP family protein refolding chaperone [Salinivibrio kushneri]